MRTFNAYAAFQKLFCQEPGERINIRHIHTYNIYKPHVYLYVYMYAYVDHVLSAYSCIATCDYKHSCAPMCARCLPICPCVCAHDLLFRPARLVNPESVLFSVQACAIKTGISGNMQQKLPQACRLCIGMASGNERGSVLRSMKRYTSPHLHSPPWASLPAVLHKLLHHCRCILTKHYLKQYNTKS